MTRRKRHVFDKPCWCGVIHYTYPVRATDGWRCISCRSVYVTAERAVECAITDKRAMFKARGELA